MHFKCRSNHVLNVCFKDLVKCLRNEQNKRLKVHQIHRRSKNVTLYLYQNAMTYSVKTIQTLMMLNKVYPLYSKKILFSLKLQPNIK